MAITPQVRSQDPSSVRSVMLSGVVVCILTVVVGIGRVLTRVASSPQHPNPNLPCYLEIWQYHKIICVAMSINGAIK